MGMRVMRAGRVVILVVGCLVATLGLGMLIGGTAATTAGRGA